MKYSAAKLAGVTSEHIFKRSLEDCIGQFSLNDHEKVFFFNVPSRLQEAETCGLVCLTIAADGLIGEHGRSFSGLLELAIEREFSRKGEIFHCHDLNVLAKSYFGLDGCVVDDSWNEQDIANWILEGGLVLMPYDCSKTFAPGMFGGEKSHWCVIVGFVVEDDEKCIVDLGAEEEKIELPEEDGMKIAKFVCIQPKSKRLALWNVSELIESNKNLKHCKEKNADMYHFDPNDLKGLRNQMVKLKYDPSSVAKKKL